MGDADGSGLTAAERCARSWELAKLGEWDQAERVADGITDDEDERGQALAVLAERLTRAGLLERAERTALRITADPNFFGALHEKLIALTECAAAHARCNQSADALRLVGHALADLPAFAACADWEAADLLADIAAVLAQIDQRDEAAGALERAVELIPEAGQDRDKILARIAAQLAALSLLDRAREVAASITVPELRRRALPPE
jgi:tetratricopeptide (TPR) repeat protein